MPDSESISSARVQSRATIWSAIIGAIGVIAAAWIGLGVGRSQGQEKVVVLQQEVRTRDAEIETLRVELQAQKEAIEDLRKQLVSARQGVNALGEGGEDGALYASLGNIEYRVDAVTHTGQELQVWVVATNNGANVETAINFASSLTDVSGNEHRVSDRMAGGERGGLDWFWVALPHNVPTRFGLAFSSVAPNVKVVPYLRVIMRDQGSLEFRNLPVPYRSSLSK